MNNIYYVKVLMAFIFVVSLMYLIGWAVRRFGGKTLTTALEQKNEESNMKIIDSVMLDYRRKLVVVDYAGTGYMLMISPQSETVVATDIDLPNKGKN